VLAYVGSANYYGEASDAFQPNYDVVGTAYRQAGSAFKPITYSTGFELNAITPATMFMDVRGDIVNGYSVPDADGKERGPVRIRDGLKYSLNIPAVKTQQVIGTDKVVAQAEKMGLRWDPRQAQEVAVPSLTLGVIGVHMIDLAGAYGAIADGGQLATPYVIEKITDRNGTVIYDHASDGPKPARVLSPQASYLTTSILADNTNPQTNPWWGPSFQIRGADGVRRPATLKTGTTNDFRDLQAFGYFAPSKEASDDTGAIVTGVWVGNSDFTPINGVFAADGPTFIWHDYMAEVAAKNELPVNDFIRPDGIVEKTIDAISGQLPGPNTTRTLTEVFKANDVPTQQDTTHVSLTLEAKTGKVWQPGCGDPVGAATPDPSASAAASPAEGSGKVYLDLSKWNADHPTWVTANKQWITRWSGKEKNVPRYPLPAIDAPLAPTELCTPGEVATSTPSPSPSPSPSPTPEGTPTPSPSPSANASASAKATKSPKPTPAPTLSPGTPSPTPTPAPPAVPLRPGG